jgi:hypothetical protein
LRKCQDDTRAYRIILTERGNITILKNLNGIILETKYISELGKQLFKINNMKKLSFCYSFNCNAKLYSKSIIVSIKDWFLTLTELWLDIKENKVYNRLEYFDSRGNMTKWKT